MDESLILSGLSDPERFHITAFKEIDSTNAYLMQLGKKGAPEWTVAVSEVQTSGRGRLGRVWHSPQGGLWFSILLHPDLKPEYSHHINMICALSLADFLENEIKTKTNYQLSIDLKWPNDVLIQKKKLCGILLQSNIISDKINFLVVGIGINVNQTAEDFPGDLRDKATSLKIAGGRDWNRAELLGGFLEYFHKDYHYYLAQSDLLLDSYLEKVISKGEVISLKQNGNTIKGIFKGLSPQGYLILQQGSEETVITTGEII